MSITVGHETVIVTHAVDSPVFCVGFMASDDKLGQT